ncbi:MAG: DUF4864 domain-containing protein [Rhodobacteraceae bacterium]|nr:DUF4864 domain-containing protein [Paracoccaceae bacterium]
MRNLFLSILLSLGIATSAQAEEADIHAVIDQQIMAFQADDFVEAFKFASPNIQRLFGSPQNFERMVTQGYPMVWRPGEVRYLETRNEADTFFQRVMITDQAGRVHILEYRMLLTGDGWRINGVEILDSSELNA